MVVEVGKFPPHGKPTVASIHGYVADLDRAYKRALERGGLLQSARPKMSRTKSALPA